MWFYFFKRDFKRSFSPPSSLFFHLKIFYWSFLSCIKEATKNFGEGNGNPLQYFCLENSVDRRAWQATVHGVAKESDTTEQHTHTHTQKKSFRMTNVTYIQFHPPSLTEGGSGEDSAQWAKDPTKWGITAPGIQIHFRLLTASLQILGRTSLFKKMLFWKW